MTEEKKKDVKKQIIIPALILVIGLVVLYLIFHRKEETEIKETAAQEETVVLESESVSDELEFFGNLEANKQSNLSAKVSGRVASINIEEGDIVKTGRLLAYLSLDQYGIDYNKKSDNYSNYKEYQDEQESYWDKQVDIAEENLEVEKAELKYYEKNDPDKVDMEKKSVDMAEAQLKSAKRQRDAQDESMHETSVGLGYDTDTSAQYVTDNRIFAPFGGVIVKKYVETGEVVSAGEPVAEVADMSGVKVTIDVPDTLIDQLSLGLQARVELDGLSGEYAAKVTKVNPMVDSVSRKVEVEVTLDSVPQGAKVDMFARVHINFPQRAAYFVPNNYVHSGFEGAYVIIEDGTEQLVERVSEDAVNKKTEIYFPGIANGLMIKRQ